MNSSGAKKWKSISSRILILAFFLVSFSTTVSAQDADAAAGQAIFESQCVSCHDLDRKVVGPKLRGVHQKRTEEWLVKWIRNNEALRKSGDKDAIAIYNEYGGAAMNNFESLSEKDVKNIIEFIATAPMPEKAPVSVVGSGEKEDSFYNTTVFWFILIITVFLLAIAIILKRVRNNMKSSMLEKDPTAVRQGILEDKIKPIVSKVNPTIVILAVIVGLAGLVLGPYFYKYGMNEVGVQKGYAPEQPIAYSHKLHAGELGIDCKYCHVGAEKGKNATIPSLNTCMNCHKGVQARDNYGGEISPEIQKIYTALDYDPEAKPGEEYGPNPTNIKWVRIHNLPDLAYFNHSQHVNVAGIECQKCHGPVEKMEVVQQWNTLQMGWCVDCHNETGIDLENNDYYEALHAKAKADIAENGEESKYWKDGKPFITETMNGGLECAKCHY